MTTVKTIIDGLLDLFVEQGTDLTEEVEEYLNKYFVWEKSFELSPLVCVDSTSNQHPKWTLYAKLRLNESGKSRKYSGSRQSILSIRQSMIDNGGLGVFAETTFQDKELISVYIGNNTATIASQTHEESPYKLEMTSKESLDIRFEGIHLLLGAHKINDIQTFPGKKVVGKQLTNNCEFWGLKIETNRRLVKGNEFYLEYNIVDHPVKDITIHSDLMPNNNTSFLSMHLRSIPSSKFNPDKCFPII